MDSRTLDVCYVNDNGEIICGTEVDNPRFDPAALRDSLQSALGTISPQRLNLIAQLISVVIDSPLDDDCIATRTDDTVGSANIVLAEAPPVMLLFRYVALPGNIMATYYMNGDNENKFDLVRKTLDRWYNLKAAC